MAPGRYCFDRFVLDPDDRRLTRDGEPVELNGRYFDALALLVSERGRLVTKDRFLAEVWRGVPVTDEALTQCIRTLRRQLGDDAARPRFIETAPKHGYRFIAPVTREDGTDDRLAATSAPEPIDLAPPSWIRIPRLGAAGTLGGGFAGAIGGLFYGLAGAAQPLSNGIGAGSTVLVLSAITAIVGVMGGAGVGFGIAAAGFVPGGSWFRPVIGGAVGGLVVGAVVKLLGLDAFNLLFGQSPGEITGAGEGVVLGGAIGLGAWLGIRGAEPPSLRRAVALAGMTGGVAGVLVSLFGGRLMGGSLDLLARQFPTSRLSLDPVGAPFGEAVFGPVSQTVTAGLEGALFSAVVVGALLLTRRRLDGP